MGIIHVAPNTPVQIQDQHTPIKETKTFKGIFRSVDDAAFAAGLARDAVIDAVNAGTIIEAAGRKYAFMWPTLGEVQKLYPNYRTVKHTPEGRLARPTTVHLRVGDNRTQLHYRSMLAARECWQLSSRTFNLIVAQSGGWKKVLPPAVTRIEVHDTDWKMPADYLKEDETVVPPGPLFECTTMASGKVRVRMPNDTFPSLRHTPQAILSNCIWK